MATTIASLGVSLSIRTKGFSKGLAAARKKIRRFKRDLARSTAGVRKFGAILAGVGVAGFGLLIKKMFSAIDATGKFSDVIGTSTEKLNSLQKRAELVGVEQGLLNSSLTAFTKRVGEARRGVGPLVSTLGKFDKNLLKQIVTAKSMDQALDFLADGLQKQKTAADKAALASAAFSRAGVTMIQLLGDGSQGLKDAGKEADRMGLSFSRVDAAKIELANDAIRRLHQFAEGVATRISTVMAPAIQSAADKLLNMGLDADTSSKRIIELTRSGVQSLDRLSKAISAIKAAWFAFKAAVEFTAFIVTKAMAEITFGVRKAGSFIAQLWGKVTAIIGNKFKELSYNAQINASYISQAFGRAGDVMKLAFSTAVYAIRTSISAVGQFISRIGEHINNIFKGVITGAKVLGSFISQTVSKVTDFFGITEGKAKEGFDFSQIKEPKLDNIFRKFDFSHIEPPDLTPVVRPFDVSHIKKPNLTKIKEGFDFGHIKPPQFLNSLADDFLAAAQKSSERMGTVWDDFTSTARRDQINKFFGDIIKKSESSALDIAKKIKESQDRAKLANVDTGVLDQINGTDKSNRTNFAQQIDLNRVVIGGKDKARKQEVYDPQVAETNNLIREQNAILKSSSTVARAA